MGMRGVRKRGFYSKQVQILSPRTHHAVCLIFNLSPPAGVLVHLINEGERLFRQFSIGSGKGWTGCGFINKPGWSMGTNASQSLLLPGEFGCDILPNFVTKHPRPDILGEEGRKETGCLVLRNLIRWLPGLQCGWGVEADILSHQHHSFIHSYVHSFHNI